MNTLFFRLLFTSLALTWAWAANVANATVVEQAVECHPCSAAVAKGLVVKGVLFVQEQELENGTISLRNGQQHTFGFNCDTVNVSLFTASETCSWDAVVQATHAGLEELPGGFSTEAVPRLSKIFGAVMVLVSMLILIPFKMLVPLCAAFVSAVSFSGMIVAGIFGSWLLFAALTVSLISSSYITTSNPNLYPFTYPYTLQAKASIIAAWLIFLAAI